MNVIGRSGKKKNRSTTAQVARLYRNAGYGQEFEVVDWITMEPFGIVVIVYSYHFFRLTTVLGSTLLICPSLWSC